MKKQKFQTNQYDDEGIDVDTFEANYVPDYEDEDAQPKRRDNRDDNRRGGGRGG